MRVVLEFPEDGAAGSTLRSAAEVRWPPPMGGLYSPAMSPDVIEVADGVLVATSRRDLTTSTVVVHEGTTLLVDPAWEPDELEALADFLEEAGLRVSAGFATHSHHAHILWHPGFGGAPRWATRGTAEPFPQVQTPGGPRPGGQFYSLSLCSRATNPTGGPK